MNYNIIKPVRYRTLLFGFGHGKQAIKCIDY
jgi:hypothetical protein